MIVLPPSDVLSFLSWVRWAGSLGAGAGLTVGLVEARAVQRAVSRERQSVRQEEAKTREDLLSYLNATLRHEVLNSASAILAHVDLIRDDREVDTALREKLTVIERQAQSMTTVIEDVRVLLQASRSKNGSEPVELTEMLQAEAAELAERYDHATVETALPERAVVVADPMIRRGFANLLENAVEHNNGDGAHVEISVERMQDAVSIEISDDGPGIPESERAVVAGASEITQLRHGTGLGLWVVKWVCESCGGRLRFETSDLGGTAVVLSLTPADNGTPD